VGGNGAWTQKTLAAGTENEQEMEEKGKPRFSSDPNVLAWVWEACHLLGFPTGDSGSEIQAVETHGVLKQEEKDRWE